MGFGDAFFMLTVFYFALTVVVTFLKKPAGLLSEPGH
jgi:DHA2 family multidrug resistance protein